MTQTILVLQGLPASGKSTFGRYLEHAEPGRWVRVNKDDIRERLLPNGWNKKAERDVVLPERDRLIANALVDGKNPIVDDTNFESKHIRRFYEIARPFDARVEIKTFDADVEECVRRDALRAKPVGENVIRDMARRYLGERWDLEPYVHAEGLPWAIICDLDGTLALFCQERGCDCGLNHRSPYDATSARFDTLNGDVAEVVRLARDSGHAIIFVSGREDQYRYGTERFLEENGVHGSPLRLYMRKTGDHRKDAVVKHEIFEREIRGKWNVRFVLDDRNQVVQFWRSLGLTCLQVAEGNF